MTQKTKKLIFLSTEILSLAIFSVLLWFTMTHSLRGFVFFIAGSALIHVLFDTIRRTLWKEVFQFDEKGEETSKTSVKLIKIGKYSVELNPKNVKMKTMLLDAAMGFLFAAGTLNLMDALEPYDLSFDTVGLPVGFLVGAVALLIAKFNTSRANAERARAIAERANESKSHFLATMSHEIRTPLNAIIGMTQIQLQKDNIPQEYANVFDRIYTSGDGLLTIINDILDMSKIEAGKFDLMVREYFLASLINDVVQVNVVRLGTKPINFILDVDAELPAKLMGDDIRIKQILNNILSNAIKYTDKGFIKLSVNHEEKDGLIVLRFTVADSGQGMKEDDVDNLFLAYSRFNLEVNRITEGVGLGMNITQRLVEMMRGRIEVTSEYGKGSVFSVFLTQRNLYPYEPIGAELASILEQASKLGLHPEEIIGEKLARQLSNFTFHEKTKVQIQPMPHGKVLIVDDTEINLYVAEGLLKPYKLQTETVESGFLALEKVENGAAYDIIFMDHMMPKMDGMETTQKLREMGYTGTVVALTANAIAGNEEKFQQAGFNGFISKPINVQHLDETLHRFIENKSQEPDDSAMKIPTFSQENLQGISEAAKISESPKVSKIDPKMADIFCRDAEKTIATLRETLTNGDIKLFTITVHAMRSALYNIGETTEKATAAQALEEAGNRGDTYYINAHTPSFIAMLEAIILTLRPQQTDHKSHNITEDTAFLAEQLTHFQQACEAYDDTAAYTALDKLKKKSWTTATANELEHIHNALFLHSDFERAAELAEKIVGRTP
ncbi:MAG: ATP-binding protein [Turicibacter sp.]|nr:ATP-binding protein [Turicibacter sp.]